MCFTPAISLTTAIIEFTIALYILHAFKKSAKYKILALVIFILGAYQFTEFMTCTSTNPFFWIKIGIILYTFLPATILHYARKTRWPRAKNFALYIIPAVISLYILFQKNFIISTKCTTFFINVITLFHENSQIRIPYFIYYGGFIIATAFILWQEFNEEKNKIHKRIKFISFASIILLMVGAIILFIIVPIYDYPFPSTFCQFTLLFTIMALIEARLTKKANIT